MATIAWLAPRVRTPHSQAPSTNPNTEPSINNLRLIWSACSFTRRAVKHAPMKRR